MTVTIARTHGATATAMTGTAGRAMAAVTTTIGSATSDMTDMMIRFGAETAMTVGMTMTAGARKATATSRDGGVSRPGERGGETRTHDGISTGRETALSNTTVGRSGGELTELASCTCTFSRGCIWFVVITLIDATEIDCDMPCSARNAR